MPLASILDSILVASVFEFNVAGDDGTPVIFSTQLVDSVDPKINYDIVLIHREPSAPPSTQPMTDLEIGTVLFTGDFGNSGKRPS